MSKTFDVTKLKSKMAKQSSQYERQLSRLKKAGKSTEQIAVAVEGAVENLQAGSRSFVIYGEPQSGKTEMMICLTARLIDTGNKFVLHLLNDSVDLLGQNLTRFKASGLSPGARNFSEILDPVVQIKGQTHIVFCKKNARDLQNLINKIGKLNGLVVVDDEADYASPNAKVNKGGQTRINELIAELLGKTGVYIGVTATPARLDLNNTFNNDNEAWVDFPPHGKYTGQDVFFPLAGPVSYRRELLSDQGSDPKHARAALFRFLATVAYLNMYAHSGVERNYSFLVHTSGKKADHKSDWSTMYKALNSLTNKGDKDFDKYAEQLWNIAKELYPKADPDAIAGFVVENVGRSSIVVLNSERDWKDNSSAATNPTSLFTIIIGGNIVSRGVTLENLLSMFFTRDVKHKIQQDTYIQRARMFGSRGDYLQYFELTIPNALYLDWHRCFVFHRLSLTAIRKNLGSPVWLGDNRIAVASSPSIDRSTVDLNRGEMSFPLFSYSKSVLSIPTLSVGNSEKMARLKKEIGQLGFPQFLSDFIGTTVGADEVVAIHKSVDISNYKDANVDEISRKKGFFGNSQKDAVNSAGAVHHLKVFYNSRTGRARLFYKFEGSIQFIKNAK